MKDVSIKATSGNIQPIHLQRDVNSASLDVTMDNVVIDSARNGIRYNANGTTAFALNLTLNNCKLTSEYYAYKTDYILQLSKTKEVLCSESIAP